MQSAAKTRFESLRLAALALALTGASVPARAAPPIADDEPVPFGSDTAWLAIRGRTPQQIAAALKLQNLRPASWKDGLAAANADPEGHSTEVFLAPDVHGWTLVVSTGFFTRVESRPPTFHTFTKELSKALGTEVQFYASLDWTRDRDGQCAWARATKGVTLRAYSCFQTRQRAIDEGRASEVDGLDVAVARGELVGTPDVTGIAAQWSVEPSGTHVGLSPERRLPAAVPRGFLADLPTPPPERAAPPPELAPPDWALAAAASVARPAAQLDAACRQGDATACGERALLLVAERGAKRKLARAAELAGNACEGHHAMGCTLRGWMLRRGVGVEEDRSAAPELFEKACDGGHAPACHLLGVALQRGEDTTRSQGGAWDAYERACAGGYGPACVRTGGSPGAALAPRPACKREGERETAGLDPTPFRDRLDLVRRHQRLPEDLVKDLPRWQARLLRNAVFASRGRSFEARDLRAFFSGFDWYAPASKDVGALLTPDDRRNVALLQEQEACARTTIAEDAGEDDEGDWRLVAVFLSEPDRPVPKRAQPLLGVWEPCLAVPDQGCPTLAFHPNGRVVLRAFGPARIGTWRMDGSTLRVRWFAEIRIVGQGYSPAEPGDENDEEPSRGVPRLFPAAGESSAVAPFDRLDPQAEIPTATFDGGQWWRKDADPDARR